jgi:hypothetical protein
MRRVTAPDGREWKVGRQWLPARVRIRRDGRDGDGDGDGSGDGDGLLDTMGEFFGMDDAGAGILVGFAVVALTAVLFAVVFPVIALSLELIALLALFLAGIVGRVVFRRPWHVLARTDGVRYRWPARGWRASGERVQAVADALGRGSLPPGAETVERQEIALQ